MGSQATTITHYALLIGISAYPSIPLRGCVRDVQHIEAHLKSVLGDAVETHLITAGQPDEQAELDASNSRAAWPSRDNVVSAFREITARAKAGDFVYVHFSGHGTRKPPSGEFSNASTGDLALALLYEDESTITETYLWGFELAGLLKAMVDRKLVVTLALDCCFSGSVYRSDGIKDNEAIRFLPYDEAIAVRDGGEILFPGTTTNYPASRDVYSLLNWFIDPDRYAILAACGPHEIAKNPKINGQHHGLFSYFLLEAIKSLGLSASHIEIYHYLLSNMRVSGVRRQSPWRAGNSSQAFFGHARQDRRIAAAGLVPVVRVQDGTLELQAGDAHGACDGDEFILHDFSSAGIVPPPSQAEQSTVYRITRTRALTSDLEPQDPSVAAVPLGNEVCWMARPITRRSLQRFPVRLPSNLPGREEWVAALRGRSLRVVDTGDENFAFEVVPLMENGGYRILSESGDEVALSPHSGTDMSNVAAALEHLARYRLARNLVNAAPVDSFAGSFELYMQCQGKEYRPGAELEVRDQTMVSLVVKNQGDNALYVAVLDCGPVWQVDNLCKAPYFVLVPQSDSKTGISRRTLRYRMEVPRETKEMGCQECEDVLKVIVTSRPTSFHLLELPRLGRLVEAKAPVRMNGECKETSENWAVGEFRIRISLETGR